MLADMFRKGSPRPKFESFAQKAGMTELLMLTTGAPPYSRALLVYCFTSDAQAEHPAPNDLLVVAHGAKGCGKGCAEGFGHKGSGKKRKGFPWPWIPLPPMMIPHSGPIIPRRVDALEEIVAWQIEPQKPKTHCGGKRQHRTQRSVPPEIVKAEAVQHSA
eukprot:2422573-Amphidinium_carterae.2